jgi:tetratricopeptide (TPR) repeat protein
MSELDFRDLVDGLVDWRLSSYDETKKAYATHPLIKGYFKSDFDEKIKKLCHKRIYQYFGEYAPEQPETLEEMQPLFEQVYHGCAAELYDEVVFDVYWEKISRREVFFITAKLGAWETAISLVRTFFPEDDLSKLPLVSGTSSKSWLLNAAALTLTAIGRSEEAEEPLKAAIDLYIEENQIAYASVGYRNLADLQFRTGELESGLESARTALDTAEKAKTDQYIVNSKAFLAWILHLLGKGEEAEKDAIERIRGNPNEAEAHLQNALEIARKVGMPDLEIEALLESCRLHLDMGRHKDATRDANEVLKICARTGFKLYEPEAEIVLGKAYLALNDIEQAENFAPSAYEKAADMNYRWQEGDAAHLLGEICLTSGDKVKAREWLKKAVACRSEISDPEVKQSEAMLKSL